MVRRAARLVTVVMAVAVLGAACSSSYSYVKSAEDRTYFKVPSRWTLFDEKAVMDRVGGELSPRERTQELGQTWRVAFDAAPKPSLTHLASESATHPAGLAVVRTLSFDAADSLSNSTLRNYFFDVDTALQNDTGNVTTYDEMQLDGGFRGIHMVAELTRPSGEVLTIDQTALVDQATSKIYALLVACSSQCYSKNKSQIGDVVKSWTVRAK